MSSHYVCWNRLVYRFDAETDRDARAKAFRWLDAHGYGGYQHWTGVEAHRGVA